MARELTKLQRGGLRDYAEWAGEDWRARLRADWARGGSEFECYFLLHTLRNTYGPAWLADYELDAGPDCAVSSAAPTTENGDGTAEHASGQPAKDCGPGGRSTEGRQDLNRVGAQAPSGPPDDDPSPPKDTDVSKLQRDVKALRLWRTRAEPAVRRANLELETVRGLLAAEYRGAEDAQCRVTAVEGFLAERFGHRWGRRESAGRLEDELRLACENASGLAALTERVHALEVRLEPETMGERSGDHPRPNLEIRSGSRPRLWVRLPTPAPFKGNAILEVRDCGGVEITGAFPDWLEEVHPVVFLPLSGAIDLLTHLIDGLRPHGVYVDGHIRVITEEDDEPAI